MVHPKGSQVHVRRPKEAAYTALGAEPLRCGVWGEPFMTGCQRFSLAIARFQDGESGCQGDGALERGVWRGAGYRCRSTTGRCCGRGSEGWSGGCSVACCEGWSGRCCGGRCGSHSGGWNGGRSGRRNEGCSAWRTRTRWACWSGWMSGGCSECRTGGRAGRLSGGHSLRCCESGSEGRTGGRSSPHDPHP